MLHPKALVIPLGQWLLMTDRNLETRMKFALKFVTASIIAATATGAFAQKGETVKIAWLGRCRA